MEKFLALRPTTVLPEGVFKDFEDIYAPAEKSIRIFLVKICFVFFDITAWRNDFDLLQRYRIIKGRGEHTVAHNCGRIPPADCTQWQTSHPGPPGHWHFEDVFEKVD